MLGIEEILFLLFSFLDFLERGVSSVSVSIPQSITCMLLYLKAEDFPQLCINH